MAATKRGWWIKVRLDKTEVNSIDFAIGTRKEDRRHWRTWSQGDENEFDVPTEFLNVGTLYIHGLGNPEGRNAWFCMMYQSHGVKHLDFDGGGGEDQTKNQGDTDSECDS